MAFEPQPDALRHRFRDRLAARVLIAALAAAAALALASCGAGGPGSGSGAASETLEMVAADDVKSLDPAIAYDVAGWGWLHLLYTGLLDYDESAHLIPKGALSWTISPDGKTYTFHLRRDMHFEGPLTHDRSVTAADYAYQIRRDLDASVASPGLSFYTGIAGAQAFHDGKAKTVTGLQTPDPYTLVIRLTAPDPTFLYKMALPFSYAVPHEVVEKYGNAEFPGHAEGSGPFVLGHWQRLVDLEFDRNPHYWNAAAVRLQHIHGRIGIEPVNSMMMFETGEISLSDIASPDFIRITHDPRFAPLIDKRVEMAIYYISLNCEMPPLNNLKVRQAINYAIDRMRVLQLINNRGVPASGVLPPGMPGYDPSLQGYPYDPEKAKSLLQEAGYGNGCSTDLWVRSSGGSGDEVRMAQVIKQDLEAVGIHLNIRMVAFPVWESAVETEHTVPMSINDWYQDFPDPYDFLDVLLNSKQASPTTANNNAFYKNPAMDRLLNQAATMMNPQKRMALYRQANQLEVHDAPWVCLYYPVKYELHQPWVHGFTMHPVWPAEYEKVWISRS